MPMSAMFMIILHRVLTVTTVEIYLLAAIGICCQNGTLMLDTIIMLVVIIVMHLLQVFLVVLQGIGGGSAYLFALSKKAKG